MTDIATEPESGEAPRGPGLSRRAIVALVIAALVAVALDGFAGGFAIVVVAAVLLAGLSPRVLGSLGVGCLAGVPLAVVVQGVPDDATVSPAFVSASMWPHHLAFVGFVLVGASVIIELAPHLARPRVAPASSAAGTAAPGEGEGNGAIDPVAGWPMPARIAVVAIVGFGAVVASVAVLGA